MDQSRAAAFIVSPEYAGLARPLIIVPHPYLAYARVAALFAPPVWRWPGVSEADKVSGMPGGMYRANISYFNQAEDLCVLDLSAA